MMTQKENLGSIIVDENQLTEEPTNLPSLCNNEGQIGGAIPAAVESIDPKGIDAGFGEGRKRRMNMNEQPSHERVTKRLLRERSAPLESDVSTTQWEVKAKLRCKEYYGHVHRFDFGPKPFQNFGYTPASKNAINNDVIALEKQMDKLEEEALALLRAVDERRGTLLQISAPNLQTESSAPLEYDKWQVRADMGDKGFYDSIHKLDIGPASSQPRRYTPAPLDIRIGALKDLVATIARETAQNEDTLQTIVGQSASSAAITATTTTPANTQ